MENSTPDEHSYQRYLAIANRYPIHLAVWENNLKNLLKNIKKHKEWLENIDPQGRTALQLGVTLNHFECVRILLDNGADVLDSLNKDGWSIIHEATSVGNEEMLQLLLQHRYYQRYVKELNAVPEILRAIHEAPDFYFEMKWEFSSLIPLISKFCPSDTCNVWKSGPNVRIDTTLIDFQEHGASRGRRSYIFHGTGAESRFIEVDHDKKRISTEVYDVGVPGETIELELMKPYPAHVKQRLLNPIMTTYLDVDNISFERNKSGIWGWRSDRTENINGYDCKVYNASNVELVTKTRIEHLDRSARKSLTGGGGGQGCIANGTTNITPLAHTNGIEHCRLLPSSIPIVNTIFGFKTVSDNTHEDPRMHLRLGECENEQHDDYESIDSVDSIRRASVPEKSKCNTSNKVKQLLPRSSNFSLLDGLNNSLKSSSSLKLCNNSAPNQNGTSSLTSSIGKKFRVKKCANNKTKKVQQKTLQSEKEGGHTSALKFSKSDCNKPSKNITKNLSLTTEESNKSTTDSDRSESESAFDSANSDLSVNNGLDHETKDNILKGVAKEVVTAIPLKTYNPLDITLEQYFFDCCDGKVSQQIGEHTCQACPYTSSGTSIQKTCLSNAVEDEPNKINFNVSPPVENNKIGNLLQIGRVKKEIISKSQKFKATLWLSEECPLSLQDQILPIIDLMPKNNAHFSKLKEFITLQLPPGFPVKIEIPIFHILNARITFGNICAKDEEVPGVCKLIDDKSGKLSCVIDSSVFEVPKNYTGNYHIPPCSPPPYNTSLLNGHNNGTLNNEGTLSCEAEESLLQYAIQQSLIDRGTENDKVTVWEALKKGSSPRYDDTPDSHESFIDNSPPVELSDDDLMRALELSENEVLRLKNYESAQAAQLEEILKLSLTEQ